jgi:hypothetical protein
MKPGPVFLARTLVLMCSFATLATPQAVREVRGPTWISVTSSATVLQSIQVKAPANGNITVTVTGTFVYEHTIGNQGSYCLELWNKPDAVGGCTPEGGEDAAIRSFIDADSPTTLPLFGASAQYTIVRTWPVTKGTTYTFYLNGSQNGLDSSWLFQPSITALYVPDTLEE